MTSDAATAAGPAVDYLASMPEWDWNLRAMHSGGLPPTAVWMCCGGQACCGGGAAWR